MNDTPDAGHSRRGFWSRNFHGRRPGPLVGPWVASAIIGSVVFYFDRMLPALDNVVDLIYVFLALVVFVTTARWLRARSQERRGKDRRRIDRRQPESD